MVARGFPRISIYRPGMLDRGLGDRTAEKVILSFVGGLKVLMRAPVARASLTAGYAQRGRSTAAPCLAHAYRDVALFARC